MTVSVGVIGTGIMGADHVSTLHRFVRGAVVTMVADVDLARAEAVAAALPGVRATSDPAALIADGTPHGTTLDDAVRSAEALDAMARSTQIGGWVSLGS